MIFSQDFFGCSIFAVVFILYVMSSFSARLSALNGKVLGVKADVRELLFDVDVIHDEVKDILLTLQSNPKDTNSSETLGRLCEQNSIRALVGQLEHKVDAAGEKKKTEHATSSTDTCRLDSCSAPDWVIEQSGQYDVLLASFIQQFKSGCEWRLNTRDKKRWRLALQCKCYSICGSRAWTEEGINVNQLVADVGWRRTSGYVWCGDCWQERKNQNTMTLLSVFKIFDGWSR